jgi:myo-inositol-1(or 4)-monophosphatase
LERSQAKSRGLEQTSRDATRDGVSASDRRALLATCVAAAVKGAEVVRAHAQRLDTLAWEEKSRADYVSDADRASERAIADVVASRHADAALVGEELSSSNAATRLARGIVFVADPLDGTTNFLHGFPWYAVSIGALVDGALVAGAILNVPNGELFTAVAGSGARRNGQPIRVSTIDDPLRSLVGTGFPFKQVPTQVDEYVRGFAEVTREAAGIRRVGAAALDLADVACGRYEAFWELSLAPWDVAAGILLVREAGGVVTDLAGSPAQVAQTSLVAGNPAMHAWLLGKLRG